MDSFQSFLPSIFGFFLGLIVGSFLNVCIYRIPKEESIVIPGSHCPYCNNPIRWYDNIPVLSYILLGGKCRYCKKKISPIYPMVEILTGVLTALLFFKFGFSFDAFYYAVLTWFLIAISFIDIKELQVPVKPCYFTMLFGMAFSIFTKSNNFIDSILGASLGAGVILFIIETYYIVKGKEGMGYGDANILATIGAFIGWKKVFFVVMIASIVGAVAGIVRSVKDEKSGDTPIPFGPFLSIGGYLTIFIGDLLLKFYLGG